MQNLHNLLSLKCVSRWQYQQADHLVRWQDHTKKGCFQIGACPEEGLKYAKQLGPSLWAQCRDSQLGGRQDSWESQPTPSRGCPTCPRGRNGVRFSPRLQISWWISRGHRVIVRNLEPGSTCSPGGYWSAPAVSFSCLCCSQAEPAYPSLCVSHMAVHLDLVGGEQRKHREPLPLSLGSQQIPWMLLKAGCGRWSWSYCIRAQ